MPWKPEVKVVNNGDKWSQNALVFATREEAERSAEELFFRWTACEGHRAVEVPDAIVNYAYQSGHLTPVNSTQQEQ